MLGGRVMIKSASKDAGRLIPVAGYSRASTEKQDTSCRQQRQEMEARAERDGVKIVRWFTDDGQSGMKVDTREAFLALLKEAQSSERSFEGIYVFEQDRFSRFDEVEFKHYAYLLREAGVRWFSMREGELDLWDFSAMLKAGIDQDAHHKYVRGLAYKACRGHKDGAASGRWQSKPPFGYTCTSTRRGGTGKLEPDPIASPWVARMMEWYVEGASKNEIADRLKASPVGSRLQWSGRTVAKILRNEVYLGNVTYGRKVQGLYARVMAGELVEMPKTPRRTPHKPAEQVQADCIRANGSHPAIVDARLFDKVQATLERRALKKRRRESYPLTGILVCAHCGGSVYGCASSVSGKRYYRCQAYSNYKGDPMLPECRYMVPADDIHAMVFMELFDRVLRDDKIEARRSEIVRFLNARRGAQAKRGGSLKAEIRRVEAALVGAEQRMVKADPDMMGVFAAEIRRLRAERDRLSTELDMEGRLSDLTTDVMDREAGIVVTGLRRIRAELETEDSARIHAAVAAIVESIRLTSQASKPDPKKPGRKRELAHLDFVFRGNINFTVNPCCQLSTDCEKRHESRVWVRLDRRRRVGQD